MADDAEKIFDALGALDAEASTLKTVSELAHLSSIEYDRVRESKAEELGIRVTTLDAEVKKARGVSGDDHMQGQSVDLVDPEPWPHPVDGAALLGEVRATIGDYIALPSHADIAITLWAAHAHCFDAFIHSPRLNAFAPEKGCGKTQLLDVLATITPKAVRVENLSTAVLFRLIDKYSPTLLIDECDSHLRDNDELRGALNSGHKRGGVVMRCEGDGNEVRQFKVFGPVALAGIGELPGTLKDRSILIRLKRAMPGEIKRKFDSRRVDAETLLLSKLARWCRDHYSDIKRIDPVMPGNMYNRVADNWRPLFAIADIAGGHWPKWVKDAALALNAENDDDSIRVRLLADVSATFTAKGVDRISSADLVDALNSFDEAPWCEYDRGKPISKNKLSRLLKPFGVSSNTVKFRDGGTAKGYHLKQFEDAFGRYLAGGGSKNVTALPASNGAGSGDFGNVTTDAGLRIEKPIKPCDGAGGDAVTFSKAGSGHVKVLV